MTDVEQAELTRAQIRHDVLAILEEKVKRLESNYAGTLNETTYILGDLDFESVAIVEFCMAVGKHFKKKFPFQDLVFREGKFQDFSVDELVSFLEKHLET